MFSSGNDKLNCLKEAPKNTQPSRGIVRLTVDWFPRRENNWWLGWKRITQSIRHWKVKWRLEHLGALGTMGETVPLIQSFPMHSQVSGATEAMLVWSRTNKWVNLLSLLLFLLQTEDLKEIALKISSLPKVNEKRSRIVIITHGKEPTLVAQGDFWCIDPSSSWPLVLVTLLWPHSG